MAITTNHGTTRIAGGGSRSSRTGSKNLHRDTTKISFEIPTALLDAADSEEELMVACQPFLRERVVQLQRKRKRVVPDEAREDILRMVGRIDAYATNPSTIIQLWEDIIDDEQLGWTLLYQRGEKKRGTVNASRVIALTGYLRNRGFYTESVDLLSLSKVLLVTSERPQFYSNSCQYLPRHAEEQRLGALLKKNRENVSLISEPFLDRSENADLCSEKAINKTMKQSPKTDMSALTERLEQVIPGSCSVTALRLLPALNCDMQELFLEGIAAILDDQPFRPTGNGHVDSILRGLRMRKRYIDRYGTLFTVEDVLDSLVPFAQRCYVNKVLGGCTYNEKQCIKACIVDFLETGHPTPPSDALLEDLFRLCINKLKPIHYDKY